MDVNREVPTGNQAHSAHLSGPTAQSLLRPSRHPRIAGHKRVTNTQKKQRKKDDSKGEEPSNSPYVTPTQYERDIDKSAHLQFYCVWEPKINVNVPPLGMAKRLFSQ